MSDIHFMNLQAHRNFNLSMQKPLPRSDLVSRSVASFDVEPDLLKNIGTLEVGENLIGSNAEPGKNTRDLSKVIVSHENMESPRIKSIHFMCSK